ncbi:MAG: ABC transporter permease [Campylobacterales bacterium]
MELNFIYAYGLVIIALIYSYFKNYGLEKEIFIGSIRAFIQLLLLGFMLLYLFSLETLSGVLAIFVVMLGFASYVARGRVRLSRYSFFVPFASIGISSFFVLITLFITGAIALIPQEAIPMTGLVIGNALNIYTLCMDRLKKETEMKIGEIEGKLSLGVNLEESMRDIVKSSIKSSLIPTLNNLQAIGLVFIPGIMTGMIMAGVSPLVALSYQLVIIYTLVGVALFSAISSTKLGYRFVFMKKDELV